ncbi:N-acetylmuramoyl-L-alanine amidase family protein [Paenibacillus silviterrae]|uniref:N-acetylmuramoyl-L-alanine amidase family protein n=1 Tax=Paenibacillus silviterrae TaxID=3242194 RepID=UPI002543C93D|nr:N-acetylmuramoyl-L-alanine amidase [Paenibacillus chinjuensis]
MKIALDAGHSASTYDRGGGKGVVTPSGAVFKEHTFNAGVSRYAQELLEANGFEVVQLQPLNDEDEIFLNERVEKARTFGADLLFSIHADANGNRDARGHWCFYWHDHGQSKRLAQIWDKYADSLLPHPDRNIVPSMPGTWTDFHMCRVPARYGIPAILIEHAFMTNLDDLELLQDEGFQRLCAEVIARTACEYTGQEFKSKEGDNVTKKLSSSTANNIIDSYLSPEWFKCDDERKKAEAEGRLDDAEAWKRLRDHQKALADELRDAAGIIRE